ncbi:MAG TPA: efflux RND transporter periplasmic adaptor subunit [Gemmatimonadales bacterium]|nr:efflux RND transporter periplasmic adaptor subunit [Gemmatimonadales bacterium]
MRIRFSIVLAAALAAACKKEEAPVVYQAVPVEHRDIVVSAQASGAIQPDTTVEVKSKASGEILQIMSETGATVQRGQVLIRIDPRTARNTVSQAAAQVEASKAQLQIAETNKKRADELFQSQAITQQEHDQAVLDYANAKANLVSQQVALENAQIQLEDVDVKSPITGTIIEKNVERGQVIASALSNVSGGTVLMRMANLQLVQVYTLVDETDIGKIQPGQRATVTVDAYPNRPFEGVVLKIEPRDTVSQNVTMFPVRVRIDNREGLLKPGMNTEVEVHIGEAQSVLAVPNAALRTQKDVASAAQVLGLSPEAVQQQLAQETAPAPNGDSTRRVGLAATVPDSAAKVGGAAKAANTMTTPDGRVIPLPEGVTEPQVRAIFAKFRNGEQPTPAERAILQKLRQAGGGRRNGGGGGGAGGASSYLFGGDYIVFTIRNGVITPKKVRTGITDLDFSEIKSGLADGDSVLVLPSASLIQSQQEFKNRFNRMTGGGAVPGMRSQSGTSSSGTPSGQQARPSAPARP